MEWSYGILTGMFLLAFLLFYPALQKYRVFQFYALIATAFITGWYFSESINLNTGQSRYGHFLLILFIIGLLFKSVKFYKTIK